MARKLLDGISVLFYGEDRGAKKKADEVTEAVNDVTEAAAEAGRSGASGISRLGSSISALNHMQINRVRDAISDLNSTASDGLNVSSSSLESWGAQFGQTYRNATAGMGQYRAQVDAVRGQISGLAFSLQMGAEGMLSYASNIARMGESVSDYGISLRAVAGLEQAGIIGGQELSASLTGLAHSYDLGAGGASNLLNRVAALGEQFGVGADAVRSFPEVLGVLDQVTGQFPIMSQNIGTTTEAIYRLAAASQSRLGGAFQGHIQGAVNVFQQLAGARTEVTRLFAGLGGEFPQLAQQIGLATGDVMSAFDSIMQDPARFAGEMARAYNSMDQNSTQANILRQALHEMGPNFEFLIQGGERSAEALQRALGPIENVTSAVDRLGRSAGGSTRTFSESMDLLTERFQAQLNSMVHSMPGYQNFERRVLDRQRRAYGRLHDRIETFVGGDGILSSLGRSALAARRGGLGGLTIAIQEELGGAFPRLQQHLETTIPLLADIGSGALEAASDFAPLMIALNQMGIRLPRLGTAVGFLLNPFTLLAGAVVYLAVRGDRAASDLQRLEKTIGRVAGSAAAWSGEMLKAVRRVDWEQIGSDIVGGILGIFDSSAAQTQTAQAVSRLLRNIGQAISESVGGVARGMWNRSHGVTIGVAIGGGLAAVMASPFRAAFVRGISGTIGRGGGAIVAGVAAALGRMRGTAAAGEVLGEGLARATGASFMTRAGAAIEGAAAGLLPRLTRGFTRAGRAARDFLPKLQTFAVNVRSLVANIGRAGGLRGFFRVLTSGGIETAGRGMTSVARGARTLGNVARRTGRGIHTFLTIPIGQLLGKVRVMGGRPAQALSGFAQGISRFAVNLRTLVRNVRAAGGVPRMLGALFGSLRNLPRTMAGLARGIGPSLQGALGGMSRIFSGGARALSGTAARTAARSIPYIGTIIGLIFDLPDIIRSFRTGGIVTGLRRVLHSVVNSLLLGIPDVIRQFTGFDLIETIFTGLIGAMNIDRISAAFRRGMVAQGIGEVLFGVVNTVLGGLPNMIRGALTNLTGGRDIFAEWFQAIGDTISIVWPGIQRFFSQLRDAWNQVVGPLAIAGRAMFKALEGTVISVLQAFGVESESLGGIFTNLWGGAKLGAQDFVTWLSTDGIRGAVRFLLAMVNGVFNIMTAVADLRAGWRFMIETIVAQSNLAKTAIQAGISLPMMAVGDTIAEITNAIDESIANLGVGMGEMIVTLMSSLRSMFLALPGGIGEAVASPLNEVLTNMNRSLDLDRSRNRDIAIQHRREEEAAKNRTASVIAGLENAQRMARDVTMDRSASAEIRNQQAEVNRVLGGMINAPAGGAPGGGGAALRDQLSQVAGLNDAERNRVLSAADQARAAGRAVSPAEIVSRAQAASALRGPARARALAGITSDRAPSRPAPGVRRPGAAGGGGGTPGEREAAAQGGREARAREIADAIEISRFSTEAFQQLSRAFSSNITLPPMRPSTT